MDSDYFPPLVYIQGGASENAMYGIHVSLRLINTAMTRARETTVTVTILCRIIIVLNEKT